MAKLRARDDKKVVARSFVIATTAKPAEWEPFIAEIFSFFHNTPLTLMAYIVIDGPGCFNHGVMVMGTQPQCNMHVGRLVHSMGPMSKWSDDDSGLFEAGEFYTKV